MLFCFHSLADETIGTKNDTTKYDNNVELYDRAAFHEGVFSYFGMYETSNVLFASVPFFCIEVMLVSLYAVKHGTHSPCCTCTMTTNQFAMEYFVHKMDTGRLRISYHMSSNFVTPL